MTSDGVLKSNGDEQSTETAWMNPKNIKWEKPYIKEYIHVDSIDSKSLKKMKTKL